jgi:GGDEF domain-containing protein
VADLFDAMTTNRIYKARKTMGQAFAELEKCSGTQFDPEVISHPQEALSDFKELVQISQAPQNSIDEERFAYFFKDPLTSACSSEYLNYFLRKNKETHTYRCCYFVQLHHMKAYNERFGWKLGDEVLKEVSLRLRVLFQTSHVFRVFGDDFVVLNALHVGINAKEILYKISIGFEGLKVSLQHYDFKNESIENWEHLENYLIKVIGEV